MIGKFLEENEENKSAEQDEIAIFEAVENKSDESPFALPDAQTEVLNIPAASEETSDFSHFEEKAETDSSEIPASQNFEEKTETVEPSTENYTNYTVAPSDALVPVKTDEQPQSETYHETPAENLRKTGLAWSAATVLGGSVIFMLIIGWFFDLVFGSKPWGIVGGIVLGAIIGFIQFFRITSQIFKKDDNNSLGIN